jgi:glutathione synthase/RimK-type ligase-like ATP-grasp enzyme
MIIINMDKAKEVHKSKLRDARKPLLEKLDVNYMRTLEQGKDTSTIVARKQELRDVTSHPDLVNASNIDDLKAFWPKILEG